MFRKCTCVASAAAIGLQRGRPPLATRIGVSSSVLAASFDGSRPTSRSPSRSSSSRCASPPVDANLRRADRMEAQLYKYLKRVVLSEPQLQSRLKGLTTLSEDSSSEAIGEAFTAAKYKGADIVALRLLDSLGDAFQTQHVAKLIDDRNILELHEHCADVEQRICEGIRHNKQNSRYPFAYVAGHKEATVREHIKAVMKVDAYLVKKGLRNDSVWVWCSALRLGMWTILLRNCDGDYERLASAPVNSTLTHIQRLEKNTYGFLAEIALNDPHLRSRVENLSSQSAESIGEAVSAKKFEGADIVALQLLDRLSAIPEVEHMAKMVDDKRILDLLDRCRDVEQSISESIRNNKQNSLHPFVGVTGVNSSRLHEIENAVQQIEMYLSTKGLKNEPVWEWCLALRMGLWVLLKNNDQGTTIKLVTSTLSSSPAA